MVMVGLMTTATPTYAGCARAAMHGVPGSKARQYLTHGHLKGCAFNHRIHHR